MTTCRYQHNGPRWLPGRHTDDCESVPPLASNGTLERLIPLPATTDLPSDKTSPQNGAQCPGCLPCPDDHCLLQCGRHAPTICATCLGNTRADLNTIRQLTAWLPVEAARSHTDGRIGQGPLGGDALVMLAKGHTEGGNFPDERAGDPLPPLALLASWVDVWRDILNQPTSLPARIDRELDYLNGHLTEMAAREPPFADFAREIRQLRARLEGVLHAGDRDDPAGVGCFDCGGSLIRRMTDTGMADRWTCKRCDREYTDPEYHLAIRARLEVLAS